MRFRWALFIGGVALLFTAGDKAREETQAQKVVLLELFTSQG